MKIHLPWIRMTATAVLVASVGVLEAAAQYAPYRPIAPQPAATAAAVPVVTAQQQAQSPATQYPYPTTYTAYRTPAAAQSQYPTTSSSTSAYGLPASAQAYGSPTGAQYTQPSAAYPQYPQTSSQQYPATNGGYSYVAQQPAPAAMPSPSKPMVPPAAQPSASSAMPANGMNASAAQLGACGCNAATYGAGSYYTSPACGCAPSGGYPNCSVGDYCGDNCGNQNQWFGGIYFLEMTRTDATPIKLTSQMPDVPPGTYPYYPQTDVLTTRDVSYDFREGLELRIGSTFTIGDSCSACQSTCGYNTGCGCNSCGPQTVYAWEVAWWGLNDSPDEQMVTYNGTNRIYGMKSFAGVEHDRDGGGGTYLYRPVNDYYDYEMPITTPPGAPPANYVRVVSQSVRTDFKAQNLELNFIRFPMCNTGCSTSSCGCSSGGCDACGCNSCNSGCGCDDGCGFGFSMYGSCGVRYFHVDDDFMYGSESEVNDGAGNWSASQWLRYNIDVENTLVGPQVGWTSDYCWRRWNLFCNTTFGIFDNHSSAWSRMRDADGNWSRFIQDGSNFNVRSSKDSVAFLGEMRVGVAYDFSCHWRGVLGYRAVAITGLATAAEQMNNPYTDHTAVGLIDSDNGVIIHGAQIGTECRY